MNAWLLAARPKTLTAALAPVAVGTACAHAAGGVALAAALAAALGAALIQIGTNLVNDAADFERGADTADRLGPPRVAQQGLLSVAAIWRGAALCFALAFAVGIYLVGRGGWPIAAIGLASIAAGYAYTAGPSPLAYNGLADLAVMIFFGAVAVCGTALVQVGEVPAIATWAWLPVGSLATAMLAINNLRDRDGDRRAGKRTLAVRLGRRAAIVECVALYSIAFATPIAAALITRTPALALPLVTAPLAAAPLRSVTGGGGGVELNRALAQTARLLAAHSALWAIGIAAS